MKTIKAKQTIAGASYNRLRKGESTQVSDKEASALEKAGLVEIVSDGEADKPEPKSDSSIKITDNTSKEKKQVLVKDEKKTDAGPNPPKEKDKDKK